MSTSTVFAARQPLSSYPFKIPRYTLGPRSATCKYCHAKHWIDERTSDSTILNPVFSVCCKNGKVDLPFLKVPPQALKQLLTGEHERISRSFMYAYYLQCPVLS